MFSTQGGGMRTQGTEWGECSWLVCLLAGRRGQSLSLIAWREVPLPESGVWFAWYPPFFEVPTPLPVVAAMWFPLWCYVNDREHASPHIGKQPAVVATPAVVRSEGLVQLCGLFPASDRSARVLVPATSSPTGLGSRSLSLMELGGLWDIPILVMDSLVGPAAGDIYRALFDTPPTKSLLVGVDSLLTTLFRGGLQGLLKGGKGGDIWESLRV